MPCSAVTLSIATISAIIATALLAIAFSTDNWLYYEVKRSNIQMFAAKHADADDLFNSMTNKYFYYTRTRGLFRVCFPKERPPLNAVGEVSSQWRPNLLEDFDDCRLSIQRNVRLMDDSLFNTNCCRAQLPIDVQQKVYLLFRLGSFALLFTLCSGHLMY